MKLKNFPSSAPTANPVFYRTYSRRKDQGRESPNEAFSRSIEGLFDLGNFTQEEQELIKEQVENLHYFPAGRWLWVGGTEWVRQPKNFGGAYNCNNMNLVDWETFEVVMSLLMQGCGTGSIIELQDIEKLPVIKNKINLTIEGKPGDIFFDRENYTILEIDNRTDVSITVGDSREGWCSAYRYILELSSDAHLSGELNIKVNLSNVRAENEKIKGFGGLANPVRLPLLFTNITKILNKAVGRKLNSVEVCLIVDEAALCVIAGNVRRSACIKQGSNEDKVFAEAKDNLWVCDENGKWKIDPERDSLRMSNHTRVYHHKPSLEEIKEAVTKQFYSGEGAIQYAPETIARSNADLLVTEPLKREFIKSYIDGFGGQFLRKLDPSMTMEEVEHRLGRYGLNPCGEICGKDFFCNLAEVNLNTLDPDNFGAQKKAFRAAALSVSAFLHHDFYKVHSRLQKSRELDPIVGVAPTGIFDFFVHAFGVDWLLWWQAGRPDSWSSENYSAEAKMPQSEYFKRGEKQYLEFWSQIVHDTVWGYCEREGLRKPNRCTTVQPSGTKALLTGASPGFHPHKAERYIRRITFQKEDPVAMACLDYGYSVIPAQSDKDENGNLLDDPFDSRCKEWLVEIPVEVSWANLLGDVKIEINKFSALAQFDFYMQVQRYYTKHNTSATIEFRAEEIEVLSERLHTAIQKDEGYISAALLARFDANETFPRLPFEPISKETYDRLSSEVLNRRKSDDFKTLLEQYDTGFSKFEGPMACDSDKCLIGGGK